MVDNPKADGEIAPGTLVRELMRRAGTAALATRLAGGGAAGDWPYASLVLATVDHDASPLMLLSDLADHTRNIGADPRVSLLFDGTGGREDPLTGARASVLGRAEAADDPRAEARLVARHPSAEIYRDFADFKLYRVNVARAHLVAGFGKIHWIDASELLYDATGAGALAAAEAEIVAHMNGDHADALQLIARHLLAQEGEGWRMTGVDPEGADLRLGGRLARIAFDKPVADAEACRVELVRLTKRARRRAEDPAAGAPGSEDPR